MRHHALGEVPRRRRRLGGDDAPLPIDHPREDSIEDQRLEVDIEVQSSAEAYGDLESPEFQRQAREFADAVERVGRLERLIVGQRYNHFEMIETLANPYGLLGRATLDLMKLL